MYQIALGTIILLLGVLALSWRLSDDASTRPPVSQNPLTPGMGFVDDDSQSEFGTDVTMSETDEEALLANGEGLPFLKQPLSHRRTSIDDPRTPTSKNDDLLNITRLRRHGMTESEEIWEELEDDSISQLSPFPHRKSSAQSAVSSTPASRGSPEDAAPNESTALLPRTSTSRSYRNKGRRLSRHVSESQEHERRRRKSASSQDAIGEWWKMKRWWKGKKRKGNDYSDGNENGNGAGNGV